MHVTDETNWAAKKKNMSWEDDWADDYPIQILLSGRDSKKLTNTNVGVQL